MSWSNPQMTMNHLGNATRPWHSLDSVRVDSVGRLEKRTETQAEIDACLNCPFPECSGTGTLCSTFRLHYIAKLEGREP